MPRAGADPTPAESDGEIVVTGQRQRGAVIGDIPPEITIGAAEIRSYGVSSIADLLAELAPQTGSIRGGGSPVTLLNGKRISGFAEIRDIPTEAIARVEVLPEEVALKYGFKADQKVVNIVLRQRFRAVTTELGGSTSTEGGGNNANAEATMLHIRNGSRVNIALQYQHVDPLFYDQRGVATAASAQPYAIMGNITGIAGGEVDPALSALAGRTLTVAGVPVAAAGGALPLSAFAGAANATDIARYRTLVPASEQFSVNAVVNRPLTETVTATINARLQRNDSQASIGLPTAMLGLPAGNPFSPFDTDVVVDRYLGATALRQDIKSYAAHGGLTLDGDIDLWHWNLTGTFDRSETRTRTGRGYDTAAVQAGLDAGDPTLNPFAPLLAGLSPRNDQARATATSGGADLLLTGTLFKLPAGGVSTSLRAGAASSSLDSWSLRSGLVQSGRTTRQTVNGQASIDVPLASRAKNVLAAIGDLSVNANVAADHASDFGTLWSYGYGAHWTPVDAVNVLASVTDERDAPSQAQLGNPVISTPLVTVFDYRTGKTVNVTRIDGGNPALVADHRHVFKLGLTLKPWTKTDLSLTANYVSTRTRNLIAAFPAGSASAEIEAAFPDRFSRDTDGALLAFDSRPVNFAREDRRDLRWGINFSRPIKSSLADRFAALRAAGVSFGRPPGAGGDDRRGGGGREGGGRGGGGGFGGGRLQFAVYHTVHLRDQVLIRDGLPLLDLLDGSATGSSGGQPRHEVEVQAGLSKDGFGARLSGNWQSATTVNGGMGQPAGNLHFSDLGTINLRLFANLGARPELVARHHWLRGTRVTLSVNNLFDSRQRVTDASGATPIGYQPGLLDPVGRTVKLSLRKVFF